MYYKTETKTQVEDKTVYTTKYKIQTKEAHVPTLRYKTKTDQKCETIKCILIRAVDTTDFLVPIWRGKYVVLQ